MATVIDVKEPIKSDTTIEYFVKQIRLRKSLAYSVIKDLLYKLKSIFKMNSQYDQ